MLDVSCVFPNHFIFFNFDKIIERKPSSSEDISPLRNIYTCVKWGQKRDELHLGLLTLGTRLKVYTYLKLFFFSCFFIFIFYSYFWSLVFSEEEEDRFDINLPELVLPRLSRWFIHYPSPYIGFSEILKDSLGNFKHKKKNKKEKEKKKKKKKQKRWRPQSSSRRSKQQ